MRLPTRPHRQGRRAAATMELAMFLPLLVSLMLGLWELGRALQVFQDVSNAAREGARQAATAKYTKDEVRQAVFDYLQKAKVPLSDTVPVGSETLANTNATINVTNLTTGGEVYDATQLDRMQVAVAVPVKNYRWVLTSTFLPAASSVTSTLTFLCTRDVPIVVNVAIPQQPLPTS
ncbi:MAG: TadE/TadG family type IV pilus assembly protein [Gemmataceae bacterium]